MVGGHLRTRATYSMSLYLPHPTFRVHACSHCSSASATRPEAYKIAASAARASALFGARRATFRNSRSAAASSPSCAAASAALAEAYTAPSSLCVVLAPFLKPRLVWNRAADSK